MSIKPYNQSVSIEMTTDQVLLALATVTTSIAELKKYLESDGEKDPDAIEETKETIEELSLLFDVFDNARKRIEKSWSE